MKGGGQGRPTPGGTPGGGVPPGPPNPGPVSDQKMSFSTPVFRSGVTKRNLRVYIDRNYVIIAEIRTLAKGFLSYSFVIETTNTSIHYRSSLVNHTRFQSKMGKIYIRSQVKRAP